MSSFDSRLAEIHPETPAEWRAWLAEHHAGCEGVWVIYFRASTGRRRLSWEQAVREALCFGWIDSKSKPIDDARYKQIFTPRKPRGVWSKVNKRHVEQLIAEGRMAEAGLRAIERGKETGAWSFLDPIDALIVPDDLSAALAASAAARAAYEALPRSGKRALLYGLYSAKREATRARRLAKALAELEAQAGG